MLTELAAPPETPWPIFRDFICEQTGDDGAYARWLSESGTLERLGECISLLQWPVTAVLGRGEPSIVELRRDEACTFRHWLYGVAYATGHLQSGQVNVNGWSKLCMAFGVPPVMVEVQSAPTMPWSVPSPQLATAVLRLAVEVGWKWLHMPYAQQQIGGAAKQHHPTAIAYRLRLLPDGPWHERRL